MFLMEKILPISGVLIKITVFETIFVRAILLLAEGTTTHAQGYVVLVTRADFYKPNLKIN